MLAAAPASSRIVAAAPPATRRAAAPARASASVAAAPRAMAASLVSTRLSGARANLRAAPARSSVRVASSLRGQFCTPANVDLDNSSDPVATIVTITVQDYPGLLSTLSWVLNGMDLVARDAVVRTSADGTAVNQFWLTDVRGRKLRDADASMVADCIRDNVQHCQTPPAAPGDVARATWSEGPVCVSNAEHDKHTVLTVSEANPKPGYLLDIASVLSGLNIGIAEGLIQGSEDDLDPKQGGKKSKAGQQAGGAPASSSSSSSSSSSPSSSSSSSKRRTFRFWIHDGSGNKLEQRAVSALIFTMGLKLAPSGQPTRRPDMAFAALA